jgi:DNA mismatch repair ATPase MutS
MAAVASASAWAFTSLPAFPFVVVVLIEIMVARASRGEVAATTHALEGRLNDLRLIASVFERIEEESVTAPLLRDLRGAIRADDVSASAAVRALQKTIEWMDASNNQLFAPVAFALQWKVQWAYVLEDWRKRHGHRVAGWLDALGTWEALSSLAGYAYERPNDPFPDIVEGEAVYEGAGLGHPLIPERSCVRNSVMLGSGTRCLIVSGSNMSGKSTLLRTVGLNAVLANAGAPVRAKSLRVAPLLVGATIRIEDDVHEGASRFYAEITRLREITKLLDTGRPLLFLLDELFAGTNSHDRGIGAAAVVKGLVDAGAIGLVTTHDLALANIAQDPKGRIENVHFEDHLENGKLTFDYQMRPGVVQKSNALELMRSIGLRV